MHVHVLQYIYKQYLSMQVMAVRLTIDDIFKKKTLGKKRIFLARILLTKRTSTSITIPSFHKRQSLYLHV